VGDATRLIKSVDSLMNDLNNEVVAISEDIARAKSGLQMDSKKTKRKVKRLEQHANEIWQRVQEL